MTDLHHTKFRLTVIQPLMCMFYLRQVAFVTEVVVSALIMTSDVKFHELFGVKYFMKYFAKYL